MPNDSMSQNGSRIFAIFHRQIEGDDALLRLARRRFEAAGMGAEIYPDSPAQAVHLWQFVPSPQPRHTVHLPRHLDAADPAHRSEILDYARQLRGKAHGLVVHDRLEWATTLPQVLDALESIDRTLKQDSEAPRLLLEYAAGLELATFVELAERVAPLERIGICIDTGHIGVFALRKRRADKPRPPGAGEPVLDLGALARNEQAARSALPELLAAARLGTLDLIETVERVASLGRPLHFHLHDMHPLSLLSRWGVQDHLSFFESVPVAPSVSASGTLPVSFGPEGLRRVVAAALQTLSPDQVTFTLEIHPTVNQAREPLGPHADLFSHWNDLTNAEMMNGWLSVLVKNAELLRSLCAPTRPR